MAKVSAKVASGQASRMLAIALFAGAKFDSTAFLR